MRRRACCGCPAYEKDGQELPLDPETRHAFEATLQGLGGQGFRALGVASRQVDTGHATAAVCDEADLVFSGFAVFLDPAQGLGRRHEPGDGRGGRRCEGADG